VSEDPRKKQRNNEVQRWHEIEKQIIEKWIYSLSANSLLALCKSGSKLRPETLRLALLRTLDKGRIDDETLFRNI
jgi:hypothetical protein